MDKPFLQSSDERIFTLDDVKRLFLRLRKSLFQVALCVFFSTFLFLSLKVPQYKAEATFKEENEKGTDSFLQNFLGTNLIGTVEPQAATLMKSFQVLKPLVGKLGLQLAVPKKGFILGKVYRRLTDNWKAEKGLCLEDLDMFVFQNVKYEGDASLNYTLRFQDADHFSVFDKGSCLASGILGREIFLPEFSFTIQRTPRRVKVDYPYSLSVAPWSSVAAALRKGIEIQSSKINKSILEISFSHRDRHLATQVLNGLMAEYRNYLKKDHDETALEQLNYLNQKQGQIYDKMSLMFQEYATYLKQSLESKGIAGLQEELRNLSAPYQNLQQTVLNLELELGHLDQMEREGRGSFLSNEGPFFRQYQNLTHTIQDLKQKRDLLEIAAHSHEVLDEVEGKLADRQEELRAIRDRRDKVQHYLQVINENSESFSEEIFDSNDSFSFWAHQLGRGAKAEDFTQYLTNHVRLLSVQEKIAQEKCFYGDGSTSHFDGIDIDMARSLFVQYNSKLDASQGLMSHYEQLIGKIEENDFEISSLSSILQDPLSQSLILEANKIAVQLKDEKHHSAKEGQRWREEIAFQKKVLMEHLEQLYKIENLNCALIREKMASLQKVSLDCINREISVLYERMKDSLKERRESLLQEKKIIEKKMGELRHLSSDFPEKWRQEKWLDLHIDMGLKTIEVMTELVEGKTIAQHLHHVESKPLDLALVPLVPKKPGLFNVSFLGAVASGLGFFFVSFLKTLLSGFPSTLEKLKLIGYPISGSISDFCDGPLVESVTGSDLELLRQLSLFISSESKGKKIGLLLGKGANYAYSLAENLARTAQKTLILHCDFEGNFSPSDVPGVLQVCRGELKELPLRHGKGFDYVPTGGFSLHGTEWIRSKPFHQVLERAEEQYDFIFILFRSPLSSAEAVTALHCCDQAIVTVNGEPTEELTPFAAWAYHEDKLRLTFITSNKL